MKPVMQQVLEYPLLIERPRLKSTIEGKDATVWSKKLWKDIRTTKGAHLIKRLVLHRGALERHERARDFGEAFKQQLEDSWQVSMIFANDTLATSLAVEKEESLLMKQKVLKYPLLIELPWLKSTIEGKNIRVWSNKQWKDIQTTLGAHLIKRLVLHCGALERHERTRDFGEAKINWRIPEKFQ